MSEVLPAGWCSVALADCILPVPGLDPADRPDDEFTYCDISAINNETGKVVSPKLLRGEDTPSRARQSVRAGDVLFSTVRPGLRAIAQVPDVTNPVASTGFCVLRAAQGIDGAYLFHLLRSDKFLQQVLPLQRGVSYPAVRDADVVSQPVLMPPAAEQTRIVFKLEELLSELDAGMAELKAAQKKLKQYRQTLLKAAVDGSLTAAWRAQAENAAPAETGAQLLARILKERRTRWEARQLAKFEAQRKVPPWDWQARYAEPVAPDIANLTALPPGWAWACAEQLCEFITKGTTPPKDFDANKQKSVPFLRVTNLTDRGELDLSDKVFVSKETHVGFLARSVVYPKDVLMNIVGPPLGQVAVVPDQFAEWNVNQAIAIFRAVAGVSSDFICQYLLSPVAQQWLKARAKTTAGQTNLTLEVCRSLPIALPPQVEQRAIAIELDATIKAAEDAWSAAEQGLRHSTAQRQNILRAAFSGQLVPQDPADEPASVLMARIRAERAAQAARKPASGVRAKRAALKESA